MENPIYLIFTMLNKFFWILLIAVTFMIAIVLKLRSKLYIQKDPTRAPGYNQLIRNYLVFMNLPWLAMGTGMMAGNFESMFDYISQIRFANPFSLLFFGTIIILVILGIVWVYFLGGADFLAAHPNDITFRTQSSLNIKIGAGVYLIGGVILLFTFWNGALG